jgi:GNAT superfamily N-acetyltransferase
MTPDAHAWSLRASSRADLDWAFDLHREAMGEYVGRTWGWDEEVQRRIFVERFDRQPRQIIQVEAVDVGVLVVVDRDNELYLELIELVSPWQGKGLGREIVRWLLRRAEESRRPLTLHVLRSNPRALAFYEREGLNVVSTEPLRLLLSSAT